MTRRRRGLTLVEILIAAVILAICAAAVLGIYSMTTAGIKGTDERRELRFYLQEIYAHVNRVSLHFLWDHYGTQGGPQRPLLGELALVDDASGQMVDPESERANPLGFTQAFVDDMKRDGIEAKIEFKFYDAQEMGLGADGQIDPEFGLLPMQAGYVSVTVDDVLDEKPSQVWKQPIMCPAIVGRPGLKLSSCPALAPRVRCKYWPELQAPLGLPALTQAEQEQCEQYRQEDAARGS